MTAEEARRISETYDDRVADTQFVTIGKAIKESALRGMFTTEVSFSEPIISKVISRLKSDGYIIKSSTSNTILINWSEK